MEASLARYPTHRDDVLVEMHERIRAQGHATKLDLAALISWKHIQNAKWMVRMLELPPTEVVVEDRRRSCRRPH
jgi:hypothetical protein